MSSVIVTIISSIILINYIISIIVVVALLPGILCMDLDRAAFANVRPALGTKGPYKDFLRKKRFVNPFGGPMGGGGAEGPYKDFLRKSAL